MKRNKILCLCREGGLNFWKRYFLARFVIISFEQARFLRGRVWRGWGCPAGVQLRVVGDLLLLKEKRAWKYSKGPVEDGNRMGNQ